MKLELTSDNDIFFLYQIVVSEDKYKQIQEMNGLHSDFSDFPQVLLKMLGNCCNKTALTSSFIGSVTLEGEDSRRGMVEFFQDTEYRRVDLLKIELEQCDEETLKNMVTYRISSTKQKTVLMQERLKDIMNIVKAKNPVLLQEIYKGTSGQGAKLSR